MGVKFMVKKRYVTLEWPLFPAFIYNESIIHIRILLLQKGISAIINHILIMGKNKHVTEGHLTLFINTFPNFSQSISNNNDFLLQVTQALP